MSAPRDYKTLSDAFLAHVALAAMRRSTALELAERIEAKLASPEGLALSEEKRSDMKGVVDWLRLPPSDGVA